MTNPQQAQFDGFAGQLVASGIGQHSPLVGLEQAVSATTYANLDAINGLIPKIKDIFIRETRVFQNPLRQYITRFDERYGAGLEQAVFEDGAFNEKLDGTCVPRGTPNVKSQLDLVNFAYSVDVDVKDNEIDKATLDDKQRGSYLSQKLRTPLKTIGALEYRAWVQLLSDVIDGSREISSKNAFNGASYKGSAASVTYDPTIKGYAGLVEKRPEVLPQVQAGVQYTLNRPLEALNICNRLKSIAADFKFESKAFNKLGASTFSTGTPLLIAETKVLDAMDTIFAEFNAKGGSNGNFGFAGFPTVSAREYLRAFCEIVEIDSFAPLPTDPLDAVVTYAGYDLHFVLIDRDAFVEVVKYANVEGQRCAKERLTGYSWRGESIFSIWRGVNAYAMVFQSGGAVTFSGENVTAAVGDTSLTSGDLVAPGKTVKMAITGGTVASITVNGTTINDDEFVMPQEDVTVTVTAAV